MRNNYFLFGINPRGTTLVFKPVPASRPENVWSPEWHLHDLDRRGMHEFCRIFGHLALFMLRIHHPDTLGRHPLFLPEDTVVMQHDDNVVQMVATDHRGAMLAHHLAVGVSDSGLALAFAEYDGNQVLATRALPFTELVALGVEPAALAVGDLILRTLLCQQPAAFAPFSNLRFS